MSVRIDAIQPRDNQYQQNVDIQESQPAQPTSTTVISPVEDPEEQARQTLDMARRAVEYAVNKNRPALEPPKAQFHNSNDGVNSGAEIIRELGEVLAHFGIVHREGARKMRTMSRNMVVADIRAQADKIVQAAAFTLASNVVSGVFNVIGGAAQMKAADLRRLQPLKDPKATTLDPSKSTPEAPSTSNISPAPSTVAAANKGKAPAAPDASTSKASAQTSPSQPQQAAKEATSNSSEASKAPQSKVDGEIDRLATPNQQQYATALFVEARGRAISQLFSALASGSSGVLSFLASLEQAEKTKLEAEQKRDEYAVSDDDNYMSTMLQLTQGAHSAWSESIRAVHETLKATFRNI